MMIMIMKILQALHNNEQNKVRRCCEETRFFRYNTRYTIAGKKFCATLNYCTRFQEKIHKTIIVRLQWEDSVGRKMIEELFATSRSKFGHSFQSAFLIENWPIFSIFWPVSIRAVVTLSLQKSTILYSLNKTTMLN
jgi:hypothetical protein